MRVAGGCGERPATRNEAVAAAAEAINGLGFIAEGESLDGLRKGYVLALAMVYGDAPQQIELEIEECADEG